MQILSLFLYSKKIFKFAYINNSIMIYYLFH